MTKEAELTWLKSELHDAVGRSTELESEISRSKSDVEALRRRLGRAEEEIQQLSEFAATAEECALRAVDKFRKSDDYKKDLLVLASHAMACSFFLCKKQAMKLWPKLDFSSLKPAFDDEQEESEEEEEEAAEEGAAEELAEEGAAEEMPGLARSVGELVASFGAKTIIEFTKALLQEVAEEIIVEKATKIACEPDPELVAELPSEAAIEAQTIKDPDECKAS